MVIFGSRTEGKEEKSNCRPDLESVGGDFGVKSSYIFF